MQKRVFNLIYFCIEFSFKYVLLLKKISTDIFSYRVVLEMLVHLKLFGMSWFSQAISIDQVCIRSSSLHYGKIIFTCFKLNEKNILQTNKTGEGYTEVIDFHLFYGRIQMKQSLKDNMFRTFLLQLFPRRLGSSKN